MELLARLEQDIIAALDRAAPRPSGRRRTRTRPRRGNAASPPGAQGPEPVDPAALINLLAGKPSVPIDHAYYQAVHEGRTVSADAVRKMASRASAEAAARGVPVRYSARTGRVVRIMTAR